jgi:hypothetical protein
VSTGEMPSERYITPQSEMYGTAEVATSSRPRLEQGWA